MNVVFVQESPFTPKPNLTKNTYVFGFKNTYQVIRSTEDKILYTVISHLLQSASPFSQRFEAELSSFLLSNAASARMSNTFLCNLAGECELQNELHKTPALNTGKKTHTQSYLKHLNHKPKMLRTAAY